MAGSRGPKDICETLSLSLCFLDTLSRYYPRINTSREHRVPPDNSSRQLLALCPVTIPELTAGQGAQLPSFWPGSHCGSFPLDRAGSRVNTIITWDGLPWERRVLLPGEQRTMSTYILLVALCI